MGRTPQDIMNENTDNGNQSTDPFDPIVQLGDDSDDILTLDSLLNYHFGYVSNITSLPSRALNSVNIPEVKNASAQFRYNFFTANERQKTNHDKPETIIFNSQNENTNDVAYLIKNQKRPRFNTIIFEPPNFLTDSTLQYAESEASLKDIIGIIENVNNTTVGDPINEEVLNSVLNKIIVEGTISNTTFTGVEIIDTLADRKIYTMLSSSIVFQNLATPADSQRELAEKLRQNISDNDSNNTPVNKILLTEVLADMQSGNKILLAPNDISEQEAELGSDQITQQSFSVKFNNLFFGDIINFASNFPNTIYEDELRSLAQIANQTQQNLINTIDSSLIYEHDYEMKVEPLKVTDLDIFADSQPYNAEQAAEMVLNSLRKYPQLKIIGFVLQKYETLKGGTSKKVADIFIDNPASFVEYVDGKVRYGAVYTYKIRTLCLVKSVFRVLDRGEEYSASLKIGDFLVLSEGKIVTALCSENIPPPPPENLSVILDPVYKKPIITWHFPFNPQRDIKRFQIFKRRTINQPFSLLAEYDFDNSVEKSEVGEKAIKENIFKFISPQTTFRDRSFALTSDTAIYAIASVDAHGMTSGYSEQIEVTYDKYTNQFKIKLISKRSAPKPYPNLYIDKDFFEDAVKSSNKDRCNIFFDPEYYNLVKKIENSDTGQSTFSRLNYFKATQDNFPYLFHFVNIDLQDDNIFKVKIVDKSGSGKDVPVSSISETNLNFEFGV